MSVKIAVLSVALAAMAVANPVSLPPAARVPVVTRP